MRDINQRFGFVNVFLCDKDLFYYESHVSLLPQQWDPPHLSFGFPSWVRSLKLCRKMPKD